MEFECVVMVHMCVYGHVCERRCLICKHVFFFRRFIQKERNSFVVCAIFDLFTYTLFVCVCVIEYEYKYVFEGVKRMKGLCV